MSHSEHSEGSPSNTKGSGLPLALSELPVLQQHCYDHRESIEAEHAEHVEFYVYFIFIFSGCTMGVLSRQLIVSLNLPLPYTVILFTLGILIGMAPEVERLSGMAPFVHINIDPHLIMFVFMPVLIFNSAFEMDVHLLRKTIAQVLILAVPGVVIVAYMLALIGQYLFDYKWSFSESMMFGSILSATDPVAVVAILSELDTSKTMGTVIEGESLVNDGTGVVLYSIFLEMTRKHVGPLEIILNLVTKAVGGPLWGYLVGHFVVFCLKHIFNDALLEITITLIGPYFVFYMGEVMETSSILSVVVFGVVLNSHKTAISPEVETFLARFWNLLNYLANTVIFLQMGVIVAREALKSVHRTDWFFMFTLYVGLNVSRALAILILSPFLRRLGYGLVWQEGVVMAWSGLRGAIALVLAMIVNEMIHLREREVRSKILIHVAGSVFLTLLINATTITALLEGLGMNDVSPAKRSTMLSALNYLRELRDKALGVLKHDRFLADADWETVEAKCNIQDPYHTQQDADEDVGKLQVAAVCSECDLEQSMLPSLKELQDMSDEAILRVLKAEKMSYWRQFEQGLLSQEAVRKLTDFTDTAADTKGRFVTAEDIETAANMPNYLVKMKRIVRRILMHMPVPVTTNPHIQKLLDLLQHRNVPRVMALVTFLDVTNMSVGMACLTVKNWQGGLVHTHRINVIFVILWWIRVICWMVAAKAEFIRYLGLMGSLIISMIGLADVFATSIIGEHAFHLEEVYTDTELQIVFAFLTLRYLRLLGFSSLLLLLLHESLRVTITSHLSQAYDVGRGFVVGEEEVRKLIEHVVDNKSLAKQLQAHSDVVKLEVIRNICMLEKQQPEIALSVKTRQAVRTVLNNLRDGIRELTEDGILQEGEKVKLLKSVEEKMKRILQEPPMVPLPTYEQMISNVVWMHDEPNLIFFLKECAKVVHLEFGDSLFAEGEPSDSIYIVASGLCRLERGQKVVDFVNTGHVIGEMGLLTGQPRTATIICETSVTFLQVSNEEMMKAMSIFENIDPPLEDRLWRVCALRLATNVLTDQAKYKGMPLDKVRLHLEDSYVFKCPECETFSLDSSMNDVILIGGRAENFFTRQQYKAPCYIPPNTLKLNLFINDKVKPVLLVVVARGYRHDISRRGLCRLHGKDVDVPQHQRKRVEDYFSKSVKDRNRVSVQQLAWTRTRGDSEVSAMMEMQMGYPRQGGNPSDSNTNNNVGLHAVCDHGPGPLHGVIAVDPLSADLLSGLSGEKWVTRTEGAVLEPPQERAEERTAGALLGDSQMGADREVDMDKEGTGLEEIESVTEEEVESEGTELEEIETD